MRLIMKLLMCLCLVPASALCQERIRNVMVGPNGGQVRIVVALIEPSQDAYKMQSMIIDLKPVKNSKEQPSSFHVDLTSTVRSLSTGKKKQAILLLRWKKPGETELKCDGKWVMQDAGTAIEKIVDATMAVIQSVPLETKTATKVTLPPEVEQKVSSTLDSVSNEDLPCVRKLN